MNNNNVLNTFFQYMTMGNNPEPIMVDSFQGEPRVVGMGLDGIYNSI